MVEMIQKLRVCVIGAGPSGISLLRSFRNAQKKGAEIPELKCFEKQSKWGGMWNYTWRTGINVDSEPIHNGMYRNMWINGPKECLEYPDYSFEKHFGKPIPSFVPRPIINDYLSGRAKESQVDQWIHYNTCIKSCSYDEKKKTFQVTSSTYDQNEECQYEKTETFDKVVCCTSHFSFPNVPDIIDFSSYYGRILHAHDFRNAEELYNKKVLLVGASFSAEDIALQSLKYGAKSVAICSRDTTLMDQYIWPPNRNIKVLPILTSAKDKKVTFANGHRESFDVIVLCTGYRHHFPFLDPDLRLNTDNRWWCNDLYEGTLLLKNNSMFYMGMQRQWFSFTMFDIQAYFIRDLILGKLETPDSHTQLQDWRKWRTIEENLDETNFESSCRFQGDYLHRLMNQVDSYPSYAIEKVIQVYMEFIHDKMNHDIATFRNKSYRSVVTNTLSPGYDKPWFDMKNDSLADCDNNI